MRISSKEKKMFIEMLDELLAEDRVYEMMDYTQHGNTSTFSHCLLVAYYSYITALRLPFGFDVKSTVRGAMLHDFYLYDWHVPHPSHRFHGFFHPGFALKNSRKYFKLNKVEEDIIEKHMWPLTLHKLPSYKESFLVSFIDKYISVMETIHLSTMPKDCPQLARLIQKKSSQKDC